MKIAINREKTSRKQAENKQKITDQILNLIRLNPDLSRIEISNKIGILSSGGVDYHLGKLKKEGRLKREGGAKGGKWIVIDG